MRVKETLPVTEAPDETLIVLAAEAIELRQTEKYGRVTQPADRALLARLARSDLLNIIRAY